MAGKLSMSIARRQGAHLDCAELSAWINQFGTDLHPGDPTRLKEYWAHGAGAAKIGWGVKGSFDRCVRHLTKYFPKDPQGLCANLHKEATGEWPTEHGKAGIPS